ncbi:MAG: adenylyl-sulfate kinase [Anaerolineae bacterium]
MPAGPSLGFAIWLTGLPSSGKTSAARELGHLLLDRQVPVQLLDSDALRRKMTPQPTYTPGERDAFYKVLVFLAGFLTDHGLNLLIAATASQQCYRQAARGRISRFAEVYVHCPPAVCRARDLKGLWARADRGEIDNLPGANAPYEAPAAPEVDVDTATLSPEAAARQILATLDAQRFFG